VTEGEDLVREYIDLRVRELRLKEEEDDLYLKAERIAQKRNPPVWRPSDTHAANSIENDRIRVHEKMARVRLALERRSWKLRGPENGAVTYIADPMGRHHEVESVVMTRREEWFEKEWLGEAV
jgi:hypothetical protein